MENFTAYKDHSAITFPHSFKSRLMNAEGYQKQLLADVMSKKIPENILACGNKEPNYDLTLRLIAKSLPDIKFFFIYRHPAEFFGSWNMRAINQQDTDWPVGKRGLFGALSLIIYLRELCYIDKECLIIPYRYFSTKVAESLSDVFDYLGVNDLTTEHASQVKSIQNQADILRNKPRSILQNEIKFLDSISFLDLDRILNADKSIYFSEIKRDIQNYIQNHKLSLAKNFFNYICDYSDTDAILYLSEMLRKPIFRSVFLEATKLPPEIARHLKLLSRRRKLIKVFLGSNDNCQYSKFITSVKSSQQ
jgi:hypothetical protein